MTKKPQSTPKSPPRAGQELLGAGKGTQNIGKHPQGGLEGPAPVPPAQELEVEAPPAPAEISDQSGLFSWLVPSTKKFL